MKRTSVIVAIGLLFAAASFGVTPEVFAQQGGTVSGRVTDARTGQPLQGARILLTGSSRIWTTDDEGRYSISNVRDGRVSVRAVMIGYESITQQFRVVNGVGTANFALAAAVISLDALVVTATGERREREVANNVSRIRAAEEVEQGAITSMSDLLSSRATGVVVQNGSGTTGSGTRIRIRGASSLSLTNEPLIYLDGIRLDNTQGALSVGVGGQQPSRIADLNPEEIESIEVVKGPSATTLYGTEAGNGVILITTKRGQGGRPRWNFWTEAGALVDDTDYPSNFRALSTTGGRCLNFQAAAGSCTQSGEVQSFNPLKDDETTPVARGNRQQFGLNVSGGNAQTSYFLSGEIERELGTFRLPDSTSARIEAGGGSLPSNLTRPNQLQRVSLRANVTSRVRENATFRVSMGYVTSDLRLPQNDNNSLGMITSAFLGGATPETGWGFFTPDEVFSIRTDSDVERFTGSLQSTWDPFSWLTTRGNFGVDLTNQFDNNFFPTGAVPSGSLIDGTRNSNRIQRFQYTADVSGTATAVLSNRIVSKSSVGFQYFNNINRGTFAFGNRIPKGTSSLAGAVITTATEATTENVTVGVFAEQTLSLNDRIFITGGVRVDDNNAFGADLDVVAYPKVSGSWVISEESFFPTGSFLSGLKLRAAWGETGVQPTQNAATRFFTPVAVTAGGVDVVGVTVGAFGNVDLKPERSEEIEVGFDSELFNGRVGLDLTYYNIRTEDALVSRRLAPSLGSSTTRFVNLAEVRNRGFEGTLSAQILQNRNAKWDIAVRGSTVENDVIDLGNDVEPIIFGLGGNAQRHQNGFPAGAYFQRPILSFDDANGDGIIGVDEVVVGDSAVFLGTPLPKRELSIQSSVTFWNRIRISGLLDHRGGHKLQNGTDFFRCAQFFNCEEANVPGSDPEVQAGIAAFRAAGTRAGFVENASFWKLRELSVTLFAPNSWMRAFGNVDQLSLTLTGRNLFTITDYNGVDPEVITNSGANFSTADFLTQPPIRYWAARLNIGF